MYYFFLAPNYYSPDVKKVIYIDIDTVVQKDLTDVWQFFTTAIFTGTKCTTIFPYIQYQNQMNALGKLDEVAFKYSEFLDTDLTKYQNYLNSGVLIINLDKLRTVDLNDLFNVAKLHYFGDQDLICYYFEKDIVNFPIKYNFCIHFFIDQIYIKQLSINQITINDLNNYQNFAYILHITAR
jgi:lipopolysaccharide biosynthesis glycosyltransferase